MRRTLPRRWFARLACAILVVLGGCRDGDDAIHGTGVYDRPVGHIPDSCAVPGEGCPCEQVGSYADCGEVEVRSGDYVTCSMGKRLCMIDALWGACEGDQTTTQYDPSASLDTLAVTGPSECVDNPCDPYCYTLTDDGLNIPDLPTGTCQSTGGGVVLCKNTCGYSGPHGGLSYESLPVAWQKLPSSCSASADTCGYNSNCTTGGGCADWAYPCYDEAPPNCTLAKKIDLQLGPPCKSATGSTYHFQVCNRGSDTADAGVVKIGIYTDSAKITTAEFTSTNPGAPNAGIVTFTLGTEPGTYIAPGQCIDVTTGNSESTPDPLTGLTATRAVAVNYDASLPECNKTNNWQVFDSTNVCTDCMNLQCNQTCPSTTLTGRVMDPRGDTGVAATTGNPIPGAVVYVPNDAVTPLTDGVACDTCASLFSGTPITSTVSASDGTFTLTNVPDSTPFKLVIQTGRWRRVVDVDAITACGTATLPTSKARLPRNQTEGDIPKMAIAMAAGDHLQCLLRKIGIDDSEFTPRTGTGRIHLYAFNGMILGTTSAPTTHCKNPSNGTCANDLYDASTTLDEYSAIIAPCDKNPFGGSPGATNPYYGTTSAMTPYSEGPYPNSYGYTSFNDAQTRLSPLNTNRPPFPTHPDSANAAAQPRLSAPTASQIQNLKAYIDKGGRLFATHWMGYFLTAPSYPAAVNYDFGDFVDRDRGPPDFPFTIDTSTPLGLTFATWLDASTVTFKRWRHLSQSVNAPAIALASGDSRLPPVNHPTCTANATTGVTTPTSCGTTPTSSNTIGGWGGPQVPAFQFDTPWGVPAANQCGRVVVAQSHVSESNSMTTQQGVFPAACATGTTMTGEEKAFEFLLFSTTQCLGTVAPPPPPATPLTAATVTFDYYSDCPFGTHPEWQFLQWQATVPVGTSIDFKARTAETQDDLDTATDVNAGTASATTGAVWTSDPSTVEDQLQNHDPELTSRKWLRISAKLNPQDNATPTLLKWRQTFDCKPAE